MIDIILKLLRTTEQDSYPVNVAKGLYKYPETWSELKRYMKFRYNNTYR